MVQIFYFINIRYLPPILLGLPIDYQSFLAPAFINPNEVMGLKKDLVDMIIEETKKVDKVRKKRKMKPIFKQIKRTEIEGFIEIDQRFLAQVRR